MEIDTVIDLHERLMQDLRVMISVLMVQHQI